jgi:anti-sigma regulatory factor (Ser/Thr protein kinase)
MELTTALVAVAEATDVAVARRRASELGLRLSFDETTMGRAAIAVTEAATNLLKHAGGGEVFVGTTSDAATGLQIIAMDRGSGIKNVPASLRDGTSTAGTAGNGLGAIQRAANSFDVYTAVGAGTVIAATIYPNKVAQPSVAGVSIPAPGEQQCGDAWSVWSAGELTSIFVADGLGHGPAAAVAARAAVDAFQRHAERPTETILGLVHSALASTRGAAVAIAELDRRRGTMRYSGIGNIAAMIVKPDGSEQHLVSLSGIAGHVAHRFKEFNYSWLPGSLLVMHSDGIGTRWSLASYPGLGTRRPDVIAGVIARDHRRGRDDATVVVAQHGGDA